MRARPASTPSCVVGHRAHRRIARSRVSLARILGHASSASTWTPERSRTRSSTTSSTRPRCPTMPSSAVGSAIPRSASSCWPLRRASPRSGCAILAEQGYQGIVTDVASTKSGVIAAAKARLGGGAVFVGGHPMAGSERSGVQAASADLFRRRLLRPDADARHRRRAPTSVSTRSSRRSAPGSSRSMRPPTTRPWRS